MVLAVGPGVLIPRPETELLIDFAQQVSHAIHYALCRSATILNVVDTILIVVALKETQFHNAAGPAEEARFGCRTLAGSGHREWSYCIRAC